MARIHTKAHNIRLSLQKCKVLSLFKSVQIRVDFWFTLHTRQVRPILKFVCSGAGQELSERRKKRDFCAPTERNKRHPSENNEGFTQIIRINK